MLVRHVLPLSLLALAVLAAIDRLTGVEITFVVLTYQLPIAAVTWYRSRTAGLVVAAIATVCAIAIFIDAHGGASVSAIALNAVGAFGMFVATIVLLDALRRRVERERAERRLVVEQLRHAERLNIIGTMAAGVAHELGTPLNVISGAAEMLGEAAPTRARATELSTLILGQTEKITAIIRHLLEFGRRSGGPAAELDLDVAVARAVELLATTARKHAIDVRFEPSLGGRARVRASAREVEQVVTNLMLNGIQAMPKGGVLRVATRVEQRPGGPVAAISVEDSGSGIRDEDLPFIFDPFFTTKGVGEGTGLGLSVSYGIVSDWGGTFEVTTAPGQGTTFTVLVPMTSRPERRASWRPSAVDYASS